jgi:CheY-like chemotaxis protein
VEPGFYVLLAVTDTGHGMTPEVLARAFEPFFTTREPGKGTGLGLATVHGIVEQSGGHVWVYSEPGQGTSFKIYLPRVDEPAEKVEAPAVEEPPPRGSETVLLVEDDASLRELIRECLESTGYTVIEARHGAEALGICERGPPPIDLVMTDVVMPGMSGRELADRLRLSRPEIRVLYMSGYTGPPRGRLPPEALHRGGPGPGGARGARQAPSRRPALMTRVPRGIIALRWGRDARV